MLLGRQTNQVKSRSVSQYPWRRLNGRSVQALLIRAQSLFNALSRHRSAAQEAAASRIYGGIHFRSASEDGLTAGIAIGNWTFTHYLQRERGRDD